MVNHNRLDCMKCGRYVAPEDGRYDGGNHYCLSCWRAMEAAKWRNRLRRGPASHTTPDNRLFYDLDAPWENPGDYLRKFGIVENPWASWLARTGMLDEMFERPVCEADFGDAESREVARRLHIPIDGRRQER